MFNYIARNPYPKTTTNWFFSLFSNSSFSSGSVERGVGSLVLPAQSRTAQNVGQENLDRLSNNYALAIDQGFIQTHDEARLHTVEITSELSNELLMKDRPFIIKFNGNGGQFEDSLDRYCKEVKVMGATIIAFNYRGVGQSQVTPTTFQDLVTDGIAQVQRLVDSGADSKHILLDGHSLGGGVATLVAEHFHQKGLPVYLWNDRSFASISKAAAHLIAPNLPGVMGEVVESSIETSSWSVMNATGWDRNIASAYLRIPPQFRSHLVIDDVPRISGDGVIDFKASLHQAVRNSEQCDTGYVVTYRGTRGHNAPRSALVYKEDRDVNGQDLFETFAQKIKDKSQTLESSYSSSRSVI